MTKKNSKAEAWAELDAALLGCVPHLASFFADAEVFVELRVKVRDDGTVLAIAKGYGSDGSPVVCFGSGYGVAGALMAIDSTIQGGHWRVDKPWADRNK